MTLRERWALGSLLVILGGGGLATAPACSRSSSSPGSAPAAPGPGSRSISQVGPAGGWIPAIAFHPTNPNEVWLSGDDGPGLYKSTDGGQTWTQVSTGVKNHSAFTLKFDPANSNKIFAPGHYGRGLLRSSDGGTTWTNSPSGLPFTSTNSQIIYDFAIHPSNSSVMFAATENGLYRSTDGGANFSLVTTTLAGSTPGRAVAFRDDGVLFYGKKDGGIGFSGDNGASWTQLLGPSGVEMSGIVFSSTSLYLAYKSAGIYKLNKSTFAGGLINDPMQSGSIVNANRMVLVVKSGASAATDLILVGTSGVSSQSPSRWGFFKSTDGGSSFTQLMTGMTGNHIMSIAVDPSDSNKILVGSGLGYGVHRTTDGGATWTQQNSGVYSTASYGIAQDPSNGDRLVISATACGGFSQNYETTNGGSTWTTFNDPVVDDGVFSFDISPTNGNQLLAGTCTQGIYRSTNGRSGPWTQLVATASKYVDRFVRTPLNSALIYAVVPQGDQDHSLYVSTDGGASFSARTSVVAWNVTVHPTTVTEGILTNGSGVFVSTNSFTTLTSLGLSAEAATEGGMNSAAFNPTNPAEVYVGGGKGGIYKTTNYSSTGAGISWTKLTTPITDAPVRDIVAVNRAGKLVIYVVTHGGSTTFTANTTAGAFRSMDGGLTWTNLTEDTYPCTLTWRLLPDVRAPTSAFYMGMWSGGVLRLTDTE